ncbi:MAG: biotin/lipoyl-binding protein [Acidobacteriota bacterium]|nr:biotin/lipoyl-binding protein [Acidobacteriota bacterium]
MDGSDFWYKTPQEKNLALSEKLLAQRGRRGRSKIDLAHIGFSAWDPDRYLGWLDGAIGSYVYSRWCVLAVVLLFFFEATVFISKWSILGPDTVLYFNFAHKSLLDLTQFWLLFLILGFFHESAHGLTCKHYGGQVHRMGFMFIYLAPAFFVDVTEIWISTTKIQRLATIIAGIWVEMILCGLAMIVWSNTRTGEWLHDFAYQIILLTGFAVALINLNPLIKLDGYYFFTELIEIPDLKERSTAFLSGWFQNRILRLPVETPVVPRRRAPFFIVYALASGAYSYLLLFFAIRFSYNIASHWLAEFALVPAGALAFVIFRSRLRSLRKVAREFWERKLGSDLRWGSVHTLVTATLAAILFLPIWRDRVGAFYVIEPMHSHTLHAAVAGRVNEVLVQQGERVRAGQPLFRMSSLTAASMESSSAAQVSSARFQTFNAQLQGRSIGTAAARQSGAAHFEELAHEAQASLVIAAPADGTVLTQNPGLLLDQDVASGQSLLDLADAGPRVARIFIPASQLDRIPTGAEVALTLPGQFSVLRMTLPPPGGDAVALPPGLIARQDYKGIQLAVFYSARVTLSVRDGNPMFGVSGQAKIFGVRRSLAERTLILFWDLIKAHAW